MSGMKWVRLNVWGIRCLRCGHEWVPRGVVPSDDKTSPQPELDDPPRICPKCKSAYFDRPKSQQKG
jgi:predicted Zn-ribbon and HTH transcriptional regulator